MEINKIHNLDFTIGHKLIDDKSIDCVVTSPPYYSLRNYGDDVVTKWPEITFRLNEFTPEITIPEMTCQFGLEPDPVSFTGHMVYVFRLVRRVLKDQGTIWLNLGDSYNGYPANVTYGGKLSGKNQSSRHIKPRGYGLQDKKTKQKDLIGIPWMCAFALRADGWYLRQDIIWCLSGGTRVYAKTQKGEMPTTIKDIARLDPSTIKLWNGQKWTQLLGISKSGRNDDEIEIVLRSGERISCTPTHRFPTNRGLINAGDVQVGDVLESCTLPEPETVKDCAINEDAAWFAGLYIAEGSRSGNAIQIAGHAKESERWERVQRIATKYGGSASRTINENKMDIRVYGKILHAIIDELTNGKTAHDKGFAPCVWKYSNRFIAAMVDGYLSGDGHQDGERWRLGFCRNYNLETSLRTSCARLGYSLTLNMSSVPYNGGTNPTFRGELRKSVSDHWNNKPRSEVVEIRKARARQFYDIGVEEEPHLFALASGILTHNSKPNPMPESVTDRCTKSHEYIFLLSKSQKYYYDAESIKTPIRDNTILRFSQQLENQTGSKRAYGGMKHNGNMKSVGPGRNPRKRVDTKGGNQGSENGIPAMAIHGNGVKGHSGYFDSEGNLIGDGKANKKSVWTVTTKPFSEAHFAVFPEELIVDCIKSGCPEKGVVLDMFSGSGTTPIVTRKLNRYFLAFEINKDYIEIANRRMYKELGMFA